MQLLPFISDFILISGGLYATLLGFKIIKFKKQYVKDQEKSSKKNQKLLKLLKFGGIFILIWGILNIIYPNFNPYNFEKKIEKKKWTFEQKEQLKNQIINNSDYLKRLNPETANLVVNCFVEKYLEKFTIEDIRKHSKMTTEETAPFIMPIFNDCYKQFGLKP